MLIQEWAVGHFLVVLDIKKLGGHLARVLVRRNIRGGLGDKHFLNNGKFPVILCR